MGKVCKVCTSDEGFGGNGGFVSELSWVILDLRGRGFWLRYRFSLGMVGILEVKRGLEDGMGELDLRSRGYFLVRES